MTAYGSMSSMSGLERLFDHVTVARRVIARLSDWDVRQLCRDPFWSLLNVLPGRFWRERARQKYTKSDFEILLAQNFEIFGFYDYVNFIITGEIIYLFRHYCNMPGEKQNFYAVESV